MTRLQSAGLLMVLSAAAGCADKAVGPRSSQARVVLSATVAAQTSGAQTVDIYVSYARTTGQLVRLLKQTESLVPGTQTLSVTVNLSECLHDTDRPAPLERCTIRVDAALKDGAGAVVDSVSTAPVVADPGATVSAPQVDLTAGVSIPLSFCTGQFGVTFAAYQDGTGPWTPLSLSNGTASVRIKTGRGGLAYYQPSPSGQALLAVVYAAVSELNTATAFSCSNPVGPATVTGSVAGIGPGEFAYVNIGPGLASVAYPTSTFSLSNLATGAHDIIAARQTFVGSQFVPSGVVIRRGVAVPGSVSLATIDFTTAPAHETYPLTALNAGIDTAFVNVFLLTASRGGGATIAATFASGGFWYAVPAASRIAGDLHQVFISARAANDLSLSRTAMVVVSTPAAQSLTLGPVHAPVTVTVEATQPYVRFRATAPSQPEYGKFRSLALTQTGVTTTWSIQMTQGYRDLTTNAPLEMPDLSGVTGWNPAWGFHTGALTSWTMSSLSINGGQLFRTPVAGASQIAATRTGTITP